MALYAFLRPVRIHPLRQAQAVSGACRRDRTFTGQKQDGTALLIPGMCHTQTL